MTNFLSVADSVVLTKRPDGYYTVSLLLPVIDEITGNIQNSVMTIHKCAVDLSIVPLNEEHNELWSIYVKEDDG